MKIIQLDWFRAIAILLVLNFHFAIYLKFLPTYNVITTAGWLGVPLFFILSGFLLSLPYIRAAKESQKLPSISQFYQKRVLRIFPLYFLSMFIFLYFIFQNHIDPGEFIRHLFFIHNYQLDHSKINPPYWSLAVEVQFYFIFPIIGLIIYRNLSTGKFKLLSLCLFLGIVIPLIWRLYATYNLNIYEGNYIKLIYASTLANFDSFVFGIISAIIYSSSNGLRLKLAKPIYFLCLAGLIFIMYGFMFYQIHHGHCILKDSFWAPGFFYTFLNLFWSVCILFSLLVYSNITIPDKVNQFVIYLSTISYGLYIWHYWIYNKFAAAITESLLNTNQGTIFNIIRLILATIISFVVSTVSYFWFELPLLRLKK